jgi:Xaa-Pro aminopeptidase
MKAEIIGRIDALRQVMKTEHLDAFVFSDSDGHQGSPLAAHWRVVEWLSDFKGTGARAVVTRSSAALWVQPCDFPEAQAQLQDSPYLLMKSGDDGSPSISEWLGRKLESTDGAIVGIVGAVTSYAFVAELTTDLRQNGGINLRTNFDPLSVIWADRPHVPLCKVAQNLSASGQASAKSRIDSIRTALRKQHADGILLSAASAIAWALCLYDAGAQGSQLSCAYLLIAPDSATLYINSSRLTPAILSYLKAEGIGADDYDHIQEGLRGYFAFNILIDAQETNVLLLKFIPSRTKIVFAPSPVFALMG